jgi:serine phosphatase RsbU (regulator of sigma subunit)
MTDCRELSSNGGNGPALGLFDDAQDRTCECPMAGNDFIMLFTDGLFERKHPTIKSTVASAARTGQAASG